MIGNFQINPKYIIVLICMYIPLIAQPITQAQANACAIQSDGKIIAAGSAVENGSNQFCVARYTTNGSLDATYNSTGIITTAIGMNAQVLGLVIQPADNKAVVAGYTVQSGNTQVAIARYTTSGVLDGTFNSSGIVTTSFGDGATAAAIAIDANNKLVIAGVTGQSGQQQLLLIRYNSDGSEDASFGTGGIVTTPINNSANALTIAIQSDGKIVVGGFSSDGINGEQFTLVRYNTDGSLDTANFGTNGIVTTFIGSQSHINSIAIQSNGAIVAGGFSDTNYVIARYLSNGNLDSTFNSTGIVSQSLGSQARINDIILDSSGNIDADGFTDTSLLVLRYTSSGTLDTTFASTGQVTLLFGDSNAAQAIALQSNGQIIAAGFEDTNFLVVRYNADGSLDTTWGINGIVNQPGVQKLNIATIQDFIFAYDTSIQVGQVANAGQTITFNNIGISSGWTATTGVFACPNTGIYKIDYTTTVERVGGATGTSITFRLLGGPSGISEIAGSLETNDMESSATRLTMARNALASLNKNDNVILQMIPGGTNVQIAPGGTGIATSATLSIIRIS